jgi:hypothetical protein
MLKKSEFLKLFFDNTVVLSKSVMNTNINLDECNSDNYFCDIHNITDSGWELIITNKDCKCFQGKLAKMNYKYTKDDGELKLLGYIECKNIDMGNIRQTNVALANSLNLNLGISHVDVRSQQI